MQNVMKVRWYNLILLDSPNVYLIHPRLSILGNVGESDMKIDYFNKYVGKRTQIQMTKTIEISDYTN